MLVARAAIEHSDRHALAGEPVHRLHPVDASGREGFCEPAMPFAVELQRGDRSLVLDHGQALPRELTGERGDVAVAVRDREVGPERIDHVLLPLRDRRLTLAQHDEHVHAPLCFERALHARLHVDDRRWVRPRRVAFVDELGLAGRGDQPDAGDSTNNASKTTCTTHGTPRGHRSVVSFRRLLKMSKTSSPGRGLRTGSPALPQRYW